MKLERSSGVLLHITSLPGRYGIGTLGPEAKNFADLLARAGMSYWQILPVGPVDARFDYSPYASTSTFAGNWLFISIEAVAEEQWFTATLPAPTADENHVVSYEDVIAITMPVLKSAYGDFFSRAPAPDIRNYEKFCADESSWLDDYALYSAIAEHEGTFEWPKWDPKCASRNPKYLSLMEQKHADRIRFHKFLQYLFFKQWNELKLHCKSIGIKIIGDIPIYITLESADAWANQDMLILDDETHQPLSVAGVPPDYFSETGQRWGNPVYRWKKGNTLSPETLRWWVNRITHLEKLVDIIRIDHFRGFEAYWSIPADETTAIKGTWVKGPGVQFFNKLREEAGTLRLIAEDLGVITPEVEELRDNLGLPGMRILQFAFDFNNKNYYLPHNIDNHNCVLYTGTHDNNTTNGWFYGKEIDDNTRNYVLEYLGFEEWSDFNWKLIRQAYRSVANLIIIMAQDIPGYGEEFRMNRPGTAEGNWRFKLKGDSITEEMLLRLRRMGEIYNRLDE
ncbi:MAG: 4-alpha-glucanotransferase [Spirochaetes bacterium]|nr:4-alpha-glucanotransferase [Spirochaetota bacterium]